MATSRDKFVERFGSIYEHSPWVAAQAFDNGASDDDFTKLADAFASCVDDADEVTRLELIRAHPDLAGKAAVQGELAAESTAEQASAGLDNCSQDEFSRLQDLNARYSGKFGFPFVMAVRGSTRQAILEAFESRCQNSYEFEFRAAIDEIHKIARMRLEALAGEPS